MNTHVHTLASPPPLETLSSKRAGLRSLVLCLPAPSILPGTWQGNALAATKQKSTYSGNADLRCYQPETAGKGWQTSLPQITHSVCCLPLCPRFPATSNLHLQFLGEESEVCAKKKLKVSWHSPRRTRDALKLCLVPQYPCPCSPRGGRGVDDSVSRAHILRDHCYCEAVHTSVTEQSKLDLGGDSLQERGRVGVCKLTPTCGQAWEPPRRLRSGLPPDQRKEGTNAPVPFSVFLCP